jgi:hypothetical protein
MKTVLQQLMDLMSEQPFTFGNAINLVILNELIEKEKEQIENAYKIGFMVSSDLGMIKPTINIAEDYYNQAYNQNK